MNVKKEQHMIVSELEEFHFQALQGMYFNNIKKMNGYLLLSSNYITDNYWNYAAKIDQNFDDIWSDIVSEMNSINRTPTIYITPTSFCFNKKLPLKKIYKDAWLVWDTSNIIQIVEDSSVDIMFQQSPVNIEFEKQFVEIFKQAYGGSSDDDPYGQLPSTYTHALSNGLNMELMHSEYEFTHILLMKDKIPVSIATGIISKKKKICGIYNVGTNPQYRKSGFGTRATLSIVQKCLSEGIDSVFLNTEYSSGVHQWYEKMGFRTAFVGTCYGVNHEK